MKTFTVKTKPSENCSHPRTLDCSSFGRPPAEALAHQQQQVKQQRQQLPVAAVVAVDSGIPLIYMLEISDPRLNFSPRLVSCVMSFCLVDGKEVQSWKRATGW